MSILILLVAVLLGVVAVSVLVAVVMGTGGRPLVALAWRRVQATRAAGLVVGLLLAWRVLQRGSYGTGPMLARRFWGSAW